MSVRSLASRAVLLAGAALLLSGCTPEYDSDFVNPCAVSIEVTTYNTAAPDPDRVHLSGVKIPSLAIVHAEDAFAGVPLWAVSVKGADSYVKVTPETWRDETVVIPAHICEEVENTG